MEGEYPAESYQASAEPVKTNVSIDSSALNKKIAFALVSAFVSSLLWIYFGRVIGNPSGSTDAPWPIMLLFALIPAGLAIILFRVFRINRTKIIEIASTIYPDSASATTIFTVAVFILTAYFSYYSARYFPFIATYSTSFTIVFFVVYLLDLIQVSIKSYRESQIIKIDLIVYFLSLLFVLLFFSPLIAITSDQKALGIISYAKVSLAATIIILAIFSFFQSKIKPAVAISMSVLFLVITGVFAFRDCIIYNELHIKINETSGKLQLPIVRVFYTNNQEIYYSKSDVTGQTTLPKIGRSNTLLSLGDNRSLGKSPPLLAFSKDYKMVAWVEEFNKINPYSQYYERGQEDKDGFAVHIYNLDDEKDFVVNPLIDGRRGKNDLYWTEDGLLTFQYFDSDADSERNITVTADGIQMSRNNGQKISRRALFTESETSPDGNWKILSAENGSQYLVKTDRSKFIKLSYEYSSNTIAWIGGGEGILSSSEYGDQSLKLLDLKGNLKTVSTNARYVPILY